MLYIDMLAARLFSTRTRNLKALGVRSNESVPSSHWSVPALKVDRVKNVVPSDFKAVEEYSRPV